MTNQDVIFTEDLRSDGTLKPSHDNYKQVIWDARNGGLQQ